MKEITRRKLERLATLIGNTPLLEINYLYKGTEYRIFAKLEYYNLSGSIKDRMAYGILRDAYFNGDLSEEYEIVEATSGNTGIALAAQGAYLGNKVTIFMPDWMSSERKSVIKSYGASIVLVSKEEGGFIGSVKRAEEYAKRKNVFLPKQFENEENSLAHYRTTAVELCRQANLLDVTIDAFCAGVGTGGTIMGIGKYLKEQNTNTKVFPMEPLGSPTLRTGKKDGSHRIQGISDEFIPPLLHLDKLDDIIDVDDGDAIIMAQRLASELGLGVGISSGANLLACVVAQTQLGAKNVATVFSDDNKKYLTTDYTKSIPLQNSFLSKDIVLLGYRAVK